MNGGAGIVCRLPPIFPGQVKASGLGGGWAGFAGVFGFVAVWWWLGGGASAWWGWWGLVSGLELGLGFCGWYDGRRGLRCCR